MAQPGDFSNIRSYGPMLKDAYKAVTIAGAWEWLKLDTTPGNRGFMFCDDPMITAISKNIGYGHSGASFAMTMREMEFIAKNGWEKFIERNTDKNTV